jgi:hypothetical protein
VKCCLYSEVIEFVSQLLTVVLQGNFDNRDLKYCAAWVGSRWEHLLIM